MAVALATWVCSGCGRCCGRCFVVRVHKKKKTPVNISLQAGGCLQVFVYEFGSFLAGLLPQKSRQERWCQPA